MMNWLIDNILGLLVGLAVGAIVPFFIGVVRKKTKAKTFFLPSGETYSELWKDADIIRMFAINSFEMLSIIRVKFEQNKSLFMNELRLLVRCKSNETDADMESFRQIILDWKKLYDDGRIRKLKIVVYDCNQSNFYTIIGNDRLICGLNVFDEKVRTGQRVDYVPLVFDGNSGVTAQVIKRYKEQFDNYFAYYETNYYNDCTECAGGVIYDSTRAREEAT